MTGYQYRSAENRRRRDRGLRLITSHPDFGHMTDDWIFELETAAADSIADILHALNAAGVFEVTGRAGDDARFLDRALSSFLGDFEDEPATPAEEPRVFGLGPA